MAGQEAAASSGKMVTLRSSDGEEFEVAEETIAAASVMIGNILEDGCAGGGIPLPNVKGPILARVLEYCERHYAGGVDCYEGIGDDGSLGRFDAEFMGGVDDDTLFDLILAANYLVVQKLLDLACKTVADEIRGKSPEWIRARFHIVNDYTKEEEEEVRAENSWAFEWMDGQT